MGGRMLATTPRAAAASPAKELWAGSPRSAAAQPRPRPADGALPAGQRTQFHAGVQRRIGNRGCSAATHTCLVGKMHTRAYSRVYHIVVYIKVYTFTHTNRHTALQTRAWENAQRSAEGRRSIARALAAASDVRPTVAATLVGSRAVRCSHTPSGGARHVRRKGAQQHTAR